MKSSWLRRFFQGLVTEIRVAEGLVVGPDDVLVVHMKRSAGWSSSRVTAAAEALRRKFGDRAVIVVGDENHVELAKVQRVHRETPPSG